MAFRRYGGIHYSATNNIITNHYSNSNNFISSNQIGLNSNIVTNGLPSPSNLIFESNIDMCGNTIFNTFINSLNLSGIFLINSTNQFFPIYSSLTDYSQYYVDSSTNTLPNTSLSGQGIYQDVTISVSNTDYAYLISPNYGLKVFNMTGFSGDVLLDVFNNTNASIILSPLVPLQGNSCEIYYQNFN